MADNNIAATQAANATYLQANPNAFGSPTVPTKAPSAPSATPPVTGAPVSIIGTNAPTDTLQSTMIPAMNQGKTDLATQNAKLAYNNGQGGHFADGSGFDGQGNPIKAPNNQNTGSGGANNGSGANPPPVPPEQTPGTPEHTLLNTPEAGNQYVYDPQGNRLEVPIGNIPIGMTTTKPPSPPTVSGQITQVNGTTIKQLSDGSYGSYDAQGNFQGQATQQQYQDAQTANTLSQNIANLANGTMPLSASEQAQVNALQASFQELIRQQETANKNFTGGITIAENLYGMGNSISGLGEIKGSVDAGLQKIADLNGKMASAVSAMEDAFRRDDMVLFKSAYDVLTSAQKDRQSSLEKLKSDADTQAKDVRDFNEKQKVDKQNETHQQFQDQITSSNLSLAQKAQVFNQALQTQEFTQKQKVDATDMWYKQQEISLRRQAQSPTATGNIPVVQTSLNGVPNAQSQKQFLSALPANVSVMVKGLADYTVNPADYSTYLRKGSTGMTRADAIALAKQYDPTYDDLEWKSRQALRTNFTSGKYSQNITALNTAVTHIADLDKAFSELNNKSGLISIFNKPENSLLSVFGSGRINSITTNLKAAIDEMATAFKGSGATDEEIKGWRESINRNASKDSSKAFINKAIQLLGDRLKNVDETYAQGMGKPSDNGFLHDSAAAKLLDLQSKGYDVKIPALQENPTVKLSNFAKDPQVANTISQIRQIAPNATPAEILSQLGIQ